MEVRFSVEGKCIAAPRPRVSKFGVYYPKNYVKYRKAFSEQAKLAMAGNKPITGNVAVSVIFRNARKDSDIDNLSKTVLDSCNGIIFNDDVQVTSLTARKIVGDNAGVDVLVAPTDD